MSLTPSPVVHSSPQGSAWDDLKTEFWKDIIYKDGKIDEKQVMKELLDFSDMMHRFGVFLCDATGGKMSKLNYTEGAMRSCFNDYLEECCEEAARDQTKELEASLQEHRRVLGIARDALRSVEAAWMVEGKYPKYHQGWQQALAKEWPTLHRAILEQHQALPLLDSLLQP